LSGRYFGIFDWTRKFRSAIVSTVEHTMVIQGREIGDAELGLIRDLLGRHPSWHRTRLSQELCALWQWRDATGRTKDMACRTMLLKLHRRGLIELPPRIRGSHNECRGRQVPDILHSREPIETTLRDLQPIRLLDVRSEGYLDDLFRCLLDRYHYLGYRTDVGENLKYLALDRQDRPLACVLFGSAAWASEARDGFIGWDAPTRERNLSRLTNNTRFLILPWVRVRNLASHLLSAVVERLNRDWQQRYGHELALVETFVDRSRFQGTCYRAANWIAVGSTKGRSRNDRFTTLQVPLKDVYVYPLCPDAIEQLRAPR
jgi:hypothetical protein